MASELNMQINQLLGWTATYSFPEIYTNMPPAHRWDLHDPTTKRTVFIVARSETNPWPQADEVHLTPDWEHNVDLAMGLFMKNRKMVPRLILQMDSINKELFYVGFQKEGHQYMADKSYLLAEGLCRAWIVLKTGAMPEISSLSPPEIPMSLEIIPSPPLFDNDNPFEAEQF